MTPNEIKYFFSPLEGFKDVLILKQSQRKVPFKISIEQAERISMLDSKTVIRYETRVAKNIDQYPDFTIVNPAKQIYIQGEIKFREQRAKVLKEMNGMLNYCANEFWYVLDTNFYTVADMSFICNQVQNKKIKIMTLPMFFKRISEI